MKRKNVFIITAMLVAIGCVYFYYGFLFKVARNIESEAPDFSMNATKLIKDYNSNPEKADSLYLNKTIELTGIVTRETDSVLILEENVFCLVTEKIEPGLIKYTVTVKGKCIGFDELFQEVKLDQCTIFKQNN